MAVSYTHLDVYKRQIGFQATDGGSGSSAGLVLTQVVDHGGLNLSVNSDRTITAVSYTHLDVYKRQGR